MKHRTVRDRMHDVLKDFNDVNLESDIARNAIIDRMIDLVQSESSDPKYWNNLYWKQQEEIMERSYPGKILPEKEL
tara:strand:+ start:845 stop:1072 length:228 start_codon:yes stop_codon:yes gene_type:complete